MTEKKVIAKIEEEEVFYWQLKDEMQNYSYEVLKKDFEELDSYEITIAQNEALEKIIGGELFYLEAKSAGIDADENEVNKSLSDFMKNFPDSLAYETFLSERRINKDDLVRLIKKNIIKDKFLSTLLKKIPPVTTEDAEKYYEKIKDKICEEAWCGLDQIPPCDPPPPPVTIKYYYSQCYFWENRKNRFYEWVTSLVACGDYEMTCIHKTIVCRTPPPNCQIYLLSEEWEIISQPNCSTNKPTLPPDGKTWEEYWRTSWFAEPCTP
jgi:hypothetical protein